MRSCAHKRYPLSVYWEWKMTKFTMEKVTKNDLTIISKPHAHAHPHTIPWRKHMQSYKTIGTTLRGVRLTRGTHCLYIEGEKWLSSQWWKSDKKFSNNYTQITCTSAGLGGSVGCAVRLETRRSRVQPPPRLATFFHGDWPWNIFYGHSLPSAETRRAVVSFWRKNVHNTG